MTLEALRLKLVAAASTTDINQVVFDYNSYLNHGTKTYPLALWDFDNMEGVAEIGGTRTVTMNCWCINEVLPEDDVVGRHNKWDEIETDMVAYLTAVNQQTEISIENLRAMPFEYFPAGLLSLEREMAVRYRVELKLWC